MQKISLLIVGFVLVAVGMTLVLHNWNEVYIVFEGILSPAVAVLGLVLMFAATLKR